MKPMVADVAILGNGILGLSIAFQLKHTDPHLKVVVIGPETRIGGASMASGAMLGCFTEITKYTFANETATAKFELSRRAKELWPVWLESICEAADQKLATVKGTHVICNTVSGELDDQNFEAMMKAAHKHKQAIEDVKPADITGLNPVPTHRPLKSVYLPDEDAINSSALMGLLNEADRRKGVEFLDDEWTGLEVQASSLKGVRLKSGRRIQATRFISALGAYTQPFLNQLPEPGSNIPSLAGVGISAITVRTGGQGFTHAIRTPNRSGACGLHLVPLGEGAEYIGSTNTVSGRPETQANVGRSHFLLQCAMDQLDRNIFFSKVRTWLIGNRPITLDTYPAIGWSQMDNVYLVYGTYRDGLQCSPEIARMVTNDLLTDKKDTRAIFSPTREPIAYGSQADSVNEMIFDALSGAYENDLELPRYMTIEHIGAGFRAMAQRTYDQIDTSYAFAPDILHFLAFGRQGSDEVAKLSAYIKSHASLKP